MDSGMKATLAVLRLPAAHTTDIPPPSSPPSPSHHAGKPRGLGTPTEARSSENQRSLETLPIMYTSRNHLRNYLHFDLIFLLEDNFALLVFTSVVSEALIALCSGYLSKDVCRNNFGNWTCCLPLEQRDRRLFYKRFSLPELRFLSSVMQPTVCVGVIWLSSHHPGGTGLREMAQTC